MLVNATGFCITVRQTLKCGQKGVLVVDAEKNKRDEFLKHFDRFEEATIWILPEIEQGCPMKQQSRQEFGINLRQNPPRVLAVPGINREIFFPEFEEQFDLPAHSEQEQSFFERKE